MKCKQCGSKMELLTVKQKYGFRRECYCYTCSCCNHRKYSEIEKSLRYGSIVSEVRADNWLKEYEHR